MTDWIKIKNEYISTSISQRKLSEKHGVSFNTLKDKANREAWAKERKEQHNKIMERTQQKTVEKIAITESNRIAKILDTGDKLHEKINQSIEELTIFVDAFGDKHKASIVDVGRLRKLVSSLKELNEIVNSSAGNQKNIDNEYDELSVEEIRKLLNDCK